MVDGDLVTRNGRSEAGEILGTETWRMASMDENGHEWCFQARSSMI